MGLSQWINWLRWKRSWRVQGSLQPRPTVWVSPEVMKSLLEIARKEAPNEACGVILPEVPLRVIQLKNRSESPQDSFQIDAEELANEITKFFGRVLHCPEDFEPRDFMVWHTHPGGLIGPSKGDMEQRKMDAG